MIDLNSISCCYCPEKGLDDAEILSPLKWLAISGSVIGMSGEVVGMSGEVVDMSDEVLDMSGEVVDMSITHPWIHDLVIDMYGKVPDMYGKVLDMSGTCRDISTVELGAYIGAIRLSNQAMWGRQKAW